MKTDREKLLPEQAVRLLRAKTVQLEAGRGDASQNDLNNLILDVALIAGLLADHIERSGPA